MDMDSLTHHHDIVIIGGGPAGAATGILLAKAGYRTVILEKDHHPRFHIGESLLPLSVPYLEDLGVLDAVERIGLRKHAAEFHSPYHGRTVEFSFSGATAEDFTHAFEVRRSEFDELLFRHAGQTGAETLEGMKVSDVEHDLNEIRWVEALDAKGLRHRFHARFFVDASGRGTFLADAFETKEVNKRHRSAALYAHYQNAQRKPGKAEGNIAIHWFDHGWFWVIPLRDGSTSVGAVCHPDYLATRKGSVNDFFENTIRLCPGVSQCLESAQRETEVSATGNYSYQSSRMTGSNYLMVGDAYAFIDPVFSSGVHLALAGAFKAAASIDLVLTQPRQSRWALRAYERHVRRGLNQFAWFIYRIRTPAIRDLFMNPRDELNMRKGIISVLAGDLFRETPIRLPLMAFRVVYYLKSLLMQAGFIRRLTP